MITAKITQESIDKVAWYLIWATPEYLNFLKSDNIIPHDSIKETIIRTNPLDYKEEWVYDGIIKFFTDAGFSEKDAWSLQIGAGELIQNSAQHVYGLKKLSDGGLINVIDLSMKENPYYVDIAATTKFKRLNMSKIKNAMQTGREASVRTSGRGFAIMRTFFDACYVNHCYLNKEKSLAPYSEMGLIKLKNNFVQSASYVK